MNIKNIENMIKNSVHEEIKSLWNKVKISTNEYLDAKLYNRSKVVLWSLIKASEIIEQHPDLIRNEEGLCALVLAALRVMHLSIEDIQNSMPTPNWMKEKIANEMGISPDDLSQSGSDYDPVNSNT